MYTTPGDMSNETHTARSSRQKDYREKQGNFTRSWRAKQLVPKTEETRPQYCCTLQTAHQAPRTNAIAHCPYLYCHLAYRLRTQAYAYTQNNGNPKNKLNTEGGGGGTGRRFHTTFLSLDACLLSQFQALSPLEDMARNKV